MPKRVADVIFFGHNRRDVQRAYSGFVGLNHLGTLIAFFLARSKEP
jgi:hypothetical protein